MFRKTQRQPGQQPAGPPVDAARQALGQLTDAMKALLAAMTPAAGDRVLTYEHALGWFVENRPPVPAVGGAILRSPEPDGRTEIVQVFLVEHQQIAVDRKGVPYGRRFVVDRIDDELADAFDNTALLIVN
jgi:hypothetical protein